MEDKQKWIDWVIELQSLAQAGLYYSKDVFDLERFQRIRDITAEMMAHQTEMPFDKVKELFCNEIGYQTPKIDTRAAIIQDGKILLVKETLTGTWSMPGGWVDINKSIKENTVKEVKEEAGLDVTADRLIAVHEKSKHCRHNYPYGVIKNFVLCTVLGGEYAPNSETSEAGWFTPDNLPELSIGKNTPEQIAMCFKAFNDPDWVVEFD